jgi:2-aminoadipate transaminase
MKKDALNSKVTSSVMYYRDLITKANKTPGMISFLDSIPGNDLIPYNILEKLSHTIIRSYKNEIYSYGSPNGYEPLRETIAKSIIGNEKYKSRLLITNGSQEGLDLALKTLGNHYKRRLNIVIEDPTYIGFKDIIGSHTDSFFPIEMEKDGMNLDLLENMLKNNRIDAVYIIPDFQNPTGALLSEQKRERLAALAKKHNFFIIEDTSYRLLGFNTKIPPMMNKFHKNTFTVGSFSKIIAPGIRIGWLLTPSQFTDYCSAEKRALQLSQPYFYQILIHLSIENGSIRDHLKGLKKTLVERRDFMNTCLNKYLRPDFRWEIPSGGFFFWIECPKNMNTKKLANRALKNQVCFAPGSIFSSSKNKDRFLRLSYGNTNTSQMSNGLRILSEIISKE